MSIRRALPLLLTVLCVSLSLPLWHAAAATTPNPFAGIVTEDAFNGTPAYRASVLKRVAALGAGTTRQTLDWSLVEPQRGKQDWRRFDTWVQDCALHGIGVLPILFNAPRWASSRPRRGAKRGTYPPRDPRAFAAFAAAAARRYGPDGSFWKDHPKVPPVPIRSWQIWNEQNLHPYWLPRASAAGYLKLLAATAAAIKGVDHGAQIVTGGMPDSRLGIPLTRYVDQLYDRGGADAFDAIALNPYSKNAVGVLAAIRRVRSVMDAKSDPTGGIWVTEIGWSDSGPRNSFRLGRNGQAKAIADVLGLLWQQRDVLSLRGVIYFNWRDSRPYAGGKEFWGLHTGLLDIRGAPKPAYSAFGRAVAELR